MSIEKVVDFSMLQLAYQSFEADVRLADIQATIVFPKSQLAYQSFEADVRLADIQATIVFPKSQLAYQSFERDVKLSTIPYPGEELYLKATYNPIMFAFAGRAFLFDGSKFEEFGSPATVIFPLAVAGDGRIFVGGGMREDSTTEENLYGYGLESYFIAADRDYIAVVVPSGTVYVIDGAGNVVQTTKQLSVVPLLRGWKLVSREPFVAVVQRLL